MPFFCICHALLSGRFLAIFCFLACLIISSKNFSFYCQSTKHEHFLWGFSTCFLLLNFNEFSFLKCHQMVIINKISNFFSIKGLVCHKYPAMSNKNHARAKRSKQRGWLKKPKLFHIFIFWLFLKIKLS